MSILHKEKLGFPTLLLMTIYKRVSLQLKGLLVNMLYPFTKCLFSVVKVICFIEKDSCITKLDPSL